jgi:hypothetical protein
MTLWSITAIDTMKGSRDTCFPTTQQLTPAQIAFDVHLSATLNVTHVTVDSFYDFPAYLALWVAAVRAEGKKVWFRCHWAHWEGNNGQPADMTPAQNLTATTGFITANPTLFQPGDIFDPCDEPENSPYWNTTYTAGWNSSGPNAGTNAYNQFHLDLKSQCDAAFAAILVPGVITGVHSVGGFFAKTPTCLYNSTVATLGYVCPDSYPAGMNSTDPGTVANALITEYQQILAARPGIPLLIGELGYSTFALVDDATQLAALSAIFAQLAGLSGVVGMNYWVGSGSPTFDGTRLFAGTRADGWTLRPSGLAVSTLYGQQLKGWQRSDLMQVVVGGAPVNDLPGLSIKNAIGQRSTATFTVLDNTGVLGFLQGQPVSIFEPLPGNMLTYNQSSVETDTSGFTVLVGATLTRDTGQFWQGTASLKAVTPGSSAAEGFICYLPSGSLVGGETLTLSGYVTGASGGVRLFLYSDTLFALGTQASTTLTGLGTWQRLVTTVTLPSPLPSGNIGLRIATTTAQAITFYADGLQVEAGGVASPWSGGLGPISAPWLPFTGYVMDAQRQSPGWSSTMLHDLACADNHYLADKRIAATSYANQTCGFMVTDLWTNYLAPEGVTIQRGINKLSAQQSDIEGLDLSAFNTNAGVTLSQDATLGTVQHGLYALKIVTNASQTFQFIEARIPTLGFTPGAQVTISAWMMASTGTPTIRYYIQSSTGAVGSSGNVTISTTRTRYTVTATLPNPITATYFAWRIDTGSVAQALTLWVDGLQFEQAAAASAWELGGLVKSVQTGPTVTSYLVNYVPVSKALDDLANLAGMTWQIDANKVLWFTTSTALPAPWTYDGTQADDSPGAPGQIVEETNPLYRNAQWILSINDVTSSQVETRQGDGKLTAFTFNYPLHSVPTVTVNAVSKTVGIGQVDTGKNWYWNKGSNVLSQDPADTKLISTDTLSVTYIGEWVSNVYSQNAGAIATELALEGGGTGIVEEAHSDPAISTAGQGFQLAGALLNRYAQIGRTLSFRTRSSGLAPQQLLTVNLPPAWGMTGAQALIESVGLSEDTNWWVYDVKALIGPVNDTWVQYFQRIANPLGTLPGSAGTSQTVALLVPETAAWNWAATYTATVTACPVFPITLTPATLC